jgi:hypothetical protein
MWDPQEQRRSNAVIDGRQGNMERFKPGVQAMMVGSRLGARRSPASA